MSKVRIDLGGSSIHCAGDVAAGVASWENRAVITFPVRYEDPHVIGRGGFGAVYRARDRVLERDVAIKAPFAERDDAALARTAAVELQAAGALRHPNIVQVIDATVSAEGQPLLIMEYASVGTLLDVAKEGWDWERLGPLLFGVLDGLGFAHAHGLVHRDIKTDNILLGRDLKGGLVPKITDFGLAKVLQEHGQYESTRMGAGTAQYMPPEQFSNDTASIHPVADLYAFGVLLYTVVVGKPPWQVQGLFPLIHAKARGEYPPLKARVGELPSGLQAVVDGLLAPKPSHRFQLASDVKQALLGARSSVPGFDPQTLSPASWTQSAVFASDASAFPAAPSLGSEMEVIPPSPAVAAVRIPLLVARERERSTLWDACRRAIQGAVGLSVEGPSGVGRSRLCGWIQAQLEQEGFAEPVTVRIEGEASRMEALTRIVRNLMGLGRLHGEELRDRIRDWLDARSHPRPQDREFLELYLDPASAPTMEHNLRDLGVRLFATVDRLLATAGRRGLACVWMDDRTQDGRGRALAADLVRAARSLGRARLVLYEPLGQVQPGPLPAGFEALQVGPLSDQAIREILGDLLPSEPLIQTLTENSRGNPQLAVESARLEVARIASPVIGGARADLPSDAFLGAATEVIADDTQRSLGDLARARFQAFRMACDIPAVGEALIDVLALLPTPAPQRMVLALAEGAVDEAGRVEEALDVARVQGIVTVDRDGQVSFASDVLAKGARQAVVERPHVDDLCLRCADALVDPQWGGDEQWFLEAGLLRLEASDADGSLNLFLAVAESLRTQDLAGSRQAFDHAGRAVAALGNQPSDPRTVITQLGRARSAANSGDLDAASAALSALEPRDLPPIARARRQEVGAIIALLRGGTEEAWELATAARTEFERAGDLAAIARTTSTAADALYRQGRREEASASFAAALQVSRESGAEDQILDNLQRLGRTRRSLGDPDGANQCFQEALPLAEALGDFRTRGVVARELGHLELKAGHLERAEDRIRESVDVLETAGYHTEAAASRISLGEVFRGRKLWNEARTEYSRALSLARACNLPGIVAVALLNLGVVELALSRNRSVGRRLSALDDILGGTGQSLYRPGVEALRLAYLSSEARWPDAEDSLEVLVDLPSKTLADEDILSLLVLAAEKAAGAEEVVLASDILDLSLSLAEAVGRASLIEDIRFRLTRLGGG